MNYFEQPVPGAFSSQNAEYVRHGGCEIGLVVSGELVVDPGFEVLGEPASALELGSGRGNAVAASLMPPRSPGRTGGRACTGGSVHVEIKRPLRHLELLVTDNGPRPGKPVTYPRIQAPAPLRSGGDGLRVLDSMRAYWEWEQTGSGAITVRAVFPW